MAAGEGIAEHDFLVEALPFQGFLESDLPELRLDFAQAAEEPVGGNQGVDEDALLGGRTRPAARRHPEQRHLEAAVQPRSRDRRQNIILNGDPFTVAGVLTPGFLLNAEIMPSEGPLANMEVYLPLPLGADAVNRRGDENYNILARLKPGVTVKQAQADVDLIANRIRIQDKRHQTFGMDVIGLREQVVGDVRRPLLVLLGSVALVLLIACANVADLLLTRASARRKEVTIRTALGAGWQRLVWQLLTESAVLAILGGAAGLGIAQAAILVVRRINPGNTPRLDAIRIDATVLAFTFAVSLATGVLFGLAPDGSAIRVDLNTTLKSGGRSGQGDGSLQLSRGRLRGLLVVSELALSMMLLIGAGLLIRSFVRLGAVPPGFNPDRVLTMQVVVSGPNCRKPGALRQFYKEVVWGRFLDALTPRCFQAEPQP